MKISILFFLFLTSLVLTGCSTLSKSECLATDWEQIGLEDGKKGTGISSDLSYQKICAKHDVDVNMGAYRQGHQKGLALFCQPENGFDFGKQGYRFTAICPQEFNSEYEIGYKFYIAYRNITQTEQALNINDSTINKLEISLNREYLRLNNENLSVFEENEIRQNIDSMTGQIKDYELATERLLPLLGQRQQELLSLKKYYNR